MLDDCALTFINRLKNSTEITMDTSGDLFIVHIDATEYYGFAVAGVGCEEELAVEEAVMHAFRMVAAHLELKEKLLPELEL